MDLNSLEQTARIELEACADEAALRAWNTKYLGKQGEVPNAIDRIKEVPPAEKRAYGQSVNRVKEALTQAYEEASARAKERALAHSLSAEAVDVTLPGRPVRRGRLHVATRVMREITAI